MSNARSIYRYDSLTGFWGVPGINRKVNFDDVLQSTIHVRHNRFGNRDAEVDVASSERRFICIGGSHTWGGYIDEGQRYSNRLTEWTGCRFLNMGHSSFGLDQIFLAIQHRSNPFNPEGILVEQYPWAFHRVLNSYVNGYLKPYYYILPNGGVGFVPVSFLARFKFYREIVGGYRLFKKEFIESKSEIDLKDGYDPVYDPVFLLWKSPYYEYVYELYGKIAAKIKDYCESKKVKLLFFLTAHMQHFYEGSESELIDYDLPSKKLAAVLDKYGVPYVNFASRLIAEQRRGEPVIFSDGHLNPRGNHKVAEYLKDEIGKRGWL